MPRPHPDHAAASLLTDVLDTEPPEAWLVACDPVDDVSVALSDLGVEAARWDRLALGDRAATASPPDGVFDQVALRLPRDKVSLDLAAELVAARMPEGGTLWLYGHNDEGVKSAGKRLSTWFDDVTTIDARRHCRLFRATRNDTAARGNLDDYASDVTIELPGGPHTFKAWPGLFAKGRLDQGTALLLSVIDRVTFQEASLDFACGMGVIAAALRQRTDGAIHACDVDALAVQAAQSSVRKVRAMVGDGWGGTPPGATYGLIVSNPPLHRGRTMDFSVLDALVEQGPSRLVAGGTLLMVVQRQRPVGKKLSSGFASVEVLADDGKFRVWCAKKA